MSEQTQSQIHMTTAKIAHEIKNPLAVLRANVQLLEMEDQNEGHKRNYAVMKTEIDKMNHLILELIEASKPHMYTVEKIELNQLIYEMEQSIEAEAKCKNITFVCHVPKENMSVAADKEKLRGVLFNIIKNALEAVGPKGEIILSLKQVDSNIEIKVSDNGMGIPEKYMKYIGKPFFTTKEGGSGLGISISKKIIEEHGGNLIISSMEGKGSSICILLPEYSEKNRVS